MNPQLFEVANLIVQTGLFLATVGLVVVGYYEVNKIREQGNADFIARLNREFFYESATNRGIVRAIDEKRPVLHGNNGEFSEYDLRAFLRYFEMIERFVAKGIVSLDLVDEMFGSYIARAWENNEVKEFVTRVRDEKKDKRYFEHFEKLAKRIIAREKRYRG